MRNAIITFLIRVGGAGLAFALQAMLARIMTPEAYGGYVLVWSWLLTVGSFVSLGLAESAMRFLPRYETRHRLSRVSDFFGFGFKIVGSVAVAIGLIAAAISILVPVQDAVTRTALFVIIALPFLALEFFFEGVARSLGWFRFTSITIFIARPLLIAGACIALHAAGIALTFERVAGILTVALAGTTLFIYVVIRRRLTVRPAPVTRSQATFWLKASLPLLLVSGLDDVLAYGDVILVGSLLAPDQAALYFAAGRILALAHFAQYAVQFVAGRAFSIALTTDGGAGVGQQVRMSTALTLGATALALTTTVVAGPWLLMIFGDDFAAAYAPMCILAAGLAARALAGQAPDLLMLKGEVRSLIVITIISIALMAVLAVALTLTWGLNGAAAASAIAMLARSLMLIRAVRIRLGLRVLPAFTWPPSLRRKPVVE